VLDFVLQAVVFAFALGFKPSADPLDTDACVGINKGLVTERYEKSQPPASD